MTASWDVLFGPLFAARSDTSRAAASSMLKHGPVLRERVRAFIAAEGGATCDEVELHTGLSHQTASARVHELMRLGQVTDSGQRRKTRSGRAATVWRVVS